MADEVEIRLTAKTGDLKNGLKEASTGLDSAFDASRRLAASLAQVGNDLTKINPLTLGLAQASKEAANGISAAAKAANEAAPAMASLGHGSAGITRELIVLGHEVVSGNFSRIPGSLMVLGERSSSFVNALTAMSPAMMGVVGAAGALAGALAYFTIHAVEAGRAINAIQINAAFAGNMSLAVSEIEDITARMKVMGVGGSASRDFLATFSQIRGVSTPQLKALAAEAASLMEVMGGDAKKTAEAMGKMFDPGVSASSVAANMSGLTASQIENARAADLSENANEIFLQKLMLLDQALERVRRKFEEQRRGVVDWVDAANRYEGVGGSGADAETNRLRQQNAVIQERIKLYMEAFTKAEPQTPNQTLNIGIGNARDFDKTGTEIERLEAKIKIMREALETASGPQIDVLSRGLEQANQRLDALKFGPVMERARAEVDKFTSTWNGSQEGLLKGQEAIWQKYLAGVRSTSSQGLQIEAEVSRTKTALRKLGLEQDLRALQAATNGAKAGSEDRIAAARKEVAFAKQTWGEGSVQAIAAQQRLTAAMREEATHRGQIALREATTKIQQLDRELTVGMQHGQALFQNRTYTAAQVEQLEMGMAQVIFQEQMRELDFVQWGQDETTEVYKTAYRQREALTQQHELTMQRIRDQGLRNGQTERQREEAAWKRGFQPIGQAFGGLISQMIRGQTSLGQAAKNVAAQMLDHYVSMGANWLADQAALYAMDLAKKLLFDEAKVATTVAMQGQEVAATAVGEETRVGIKAAAATQSTAISVAEGSSNIFVRAYEAAAGAYAAITEIPIIGPALAPIVAGGVLAAVIGMISTIASAEGGYDIPAGVNPMTQLHEKEMVLPAQHADTIRVLPGILRALTASPMSADGSGVQALSGAMASSVGAMMGLRVSPSMLAGVSSGGGTVTGSGGSSGGGFVNEGGMHFAIHMPPGAARMDPDALARETARHIGLAVRNGHIPRRKR